MQQTLHNLILSMSKSLTPNLAIILNLICTLQVTGKVRNTLSLRLPLISKLGLCIIFGYVFLNLIGVWLRNFPQYWWNLVSLQPLSSRGDKTIIIKINGIDSWNLVKVHSVAYIINRKLSHLNIAYGTLYNYDLKYTLLTHCRLI